MTGKLITKFCFLVLFSCSCLLGQVNESDTTPTLSEYDQWRGSSLGIRIETKEEGYFVSKVLPHVNDSPLKTGDQILSVGPIDLTTQPLSEIGELLESTQPDAEISVKLVRNDEEQTIPVKTYRQEFVDIANIVERIQKNRIIKKHLEDLDRVDELDTMTERMVAAVQSSKSPREAYEGINQVIDELDISHTAIVPQSTYQQLVGATSGELGLAIRRFAVNGANGYFVVDKKPGTSAFESELQIGDRVEFINGVAIEQSRRLVLAGEEQRHGVFSIDAKIDEQVRLEYRRTAFGQLQTVKLVAAKPVSLRDSVAASVKTITKGEQVFGYLRFWNLMSPSANRELQASLKDEFADADALILDLRGRGGTIPTVLAIDKTVDGLDIPVIAITDELTRSAKELLSFRLKKHDHVTVIGERTTGAVTAATFATLPSGNVLMFPVMSGDSLGRYTGGVNLEGNGVEPDEKVSFYEPFCEGKDVLMDAAIEKALQQTSSE